MIAKTTQATENLFIGYNVGVLNFSIGKEIGWRVDGVLSHVD